MKDQETELSRTDKKKDRLAAEVEVMTTARIYRETFRLLLVHGFIGPGALQMMVDKATRETNYIPVSVFAIEHGLSADEVTRSLFEGKIMARDQITQIIEQQKGEAK